MKDLKSGIEHLKQAKAHMSKANGIMSNCISKLKALEEENAELRDELDDWKGNAEGFQPDSYMKLPVDADGIAIRPGDKIYFNGDPEGFALKCIAVGWPPCPVEFVDWEETGTTAWEEGSAFTHRQPTSKSVDSWEKLEEDARQRVCSYFGIDKDTASCDDCPHMLAERQPRHDSSRQEARWHRRGGAAMRWRNWAVYILLALSVIESLMMLADLIGGQDPYRNQVLAMLAMLLALAIDFKEAQ